MWIVQRSMRDREWVAAMYCLSVVLVLMLRLAWMCAVGESWSIQGCTSSSLGKKVRSARTLASLSVACVLVPGLPVDCLAMHSRTCVCARGGNNATPTDSTPATPSAGELLLFSC